MVGNMSIQYNGQIEDLHILSYRNLITPYALKAQFPLTTKAEETVGVARRNIRRILSGEDERMLLILGPCSIHDAEAAKDYSERLKPLRERVKDKFEVVMRTYFEKPRTNSADWRGLLYEPRLDGQERVNEGLTVARQFLLYNAEIGLPSGTEFVDTHIPQHLSDTVSWVAIGARTVESQLHRQLASGLSPPVGFKNSTAGNVKVAVDAVSSARESLWFPGIDDHGRSKVFLTTGNPDTHIVLRGGDNGPNYDVGNVAKAQEMLRKAGFGDRLMIDCSHGNSGKDYRQQPMIFEDVMKQRVEGNKGIVALMMESNIEEGNQKVVKGQALKYGVSITDSCIGWGTTEELILDAHRTLKGIAAH